MKSTRLAVAGEPCPKYCIQIIRGKPCILTPGRFGEYCRTTAFVAMLGGTAEESSSKKLCERHACAELIFVDSSCERMKKQSLPQHSQDKLLHRTVCGFGSCLVHTRSSTNRVDQYFIIFLRGRHVETKPLRSKGSILTWAVLLSRPPL